MQLQQLRLTSKSKWAQEPSRLGKEKVDAKKDEDEEDVMEEYVMEEEVMMKEMKHEGYEKVQCRASS